MYTRSFNTWLFMYLGLICYSHAETRVYIDPGWVCYSETSIRPGTCITKLWDSNTHVKICEMIRIPFAKYAVSVNDIIVTTEVWTIGGLSCNVISRKFCKSSYSWPPCWGKGIGKSNKSFHYFLFSSYHITKIPQNFDWFWHMKCELPDKGLVP